MARTRRTRGGIDKAVSRTVKRVSTTARRRANTGGNDLVKAVHGLVNALPVKELEKRLAGLEKSVTRLEGEIRKAAGRVVGGARRSTTKRATGAKRGTTRKAALPSSRRACSAALRACSLVGVTTMHDGADRSCSPRLRSSPGRMAAAIMRRSAGPCSTTC